MDRKRNKTITSELVKQAEHARIMKRVEEYRNLIIKELIWAEQNLEEKRTDADQIVDRISRFILTLEHNLKV